RRESDAGASRDGGRGEPLWSGLIPFALACLGRPARRRSGRHHSFSLRLLARAREKGDRPRHGPFRLGKSLGCCRRAGLSCGRQSVLQPAGPEVGRDARSDGGNATSGGFLRGSRRRGLAARLESEPGRGYDEEMTSAIAGLSESGFDSNRASATAVLVLAALISSSCASRAAPAPGSAPPAAPTRAASSAN